ncbi:MAG: thioredoxin family protein [Candidatus Binatia bacterium]|nr:MAG: thioredoxin family protein [Candidatus Binatia bacterium]
MEFVLYTRHDCCLCEEMEPVVRKVSRELGARLTVVDVDADPRLGELYGTEVPVLFFGTKKIAKGRVTERELRDRVRRWSRRPGAIDSPSGRG